MAAPAPLTEGSELTIAVPAVGRRPFAGVWADMYSLYQTAEGHYPSSDWIDECNQPGRMLQTEADALRHSDIGIGHHTPELRHGPHLHPPPDDEDQPRPAAGPLDGTGDLLTIGWYRSIGFHRYDQAKMSAPTTARAADD